MIDVSSDGIDKVLLSNEELHECKQTDMLSVLIPCRPCLHALSKYPHTKNIVAYRPRQVLRLYNVSGWRLLSSRPWPSFPDIVDGLLTR